MSTGRLPRGVLHGPWRIAITGALVATGLLFWKTGAPAQSSQEILQSRGSAIVVTGVQWMSATEDQRRAFLIGIGNLIVAEGAYAKRHDTEMPYVSDQIVKSIKSLKLADIEGVITRWYQANPGKVSTPVMAIIWQDIAGRSPLGKRS